MAMLKYGTATVTEPVTTADKWVNDVYDAHCSDGHCRMKTARTILAKYDPNKYLLSHTTIAEDIVGKLADDISICRDEGLSDLQAYNQIYRKYANTCSDYIIRFAIKKIYSHKD